MAPVSTRVITEGAQGSCFHQAVLSGTQKAAKTLSPAQIATASSHMTLKSPEAELRQRSYVAVLG